MHKNWYVTKTTLFSPGVIQGQTQGPTQGPIQTTMVMGAMAMACKAEQMSRYIQKWL